MQMASKDEKVLKLLCGWRTVGGLRELNACQALEWCLAHGTCSVNILLPSVVRPQDLS